MELLKERIRKDGVIKEGNVLKVDNFLNHQMDIKLFNEIGKEFKRRFADVKVDKILTIEASGIGIAAIVAQYFDAPVVFAKKSESINLDGEILSAPVESFTHKRQYQVIVAKRFIQEQENVLVIDDFMANGCAAMGLCQIIEGANANVAGIGIVIEKGFQRGGQMLRERGLRVESLAIVDGMDAKTQTIQFREQ
ncbi:MAG: xanthine phosphoribosyltransferase [Butyricicoccus sp.]